MVIDFYKLPIWLVFAAGLLVLTPLKAPVARKWVLAGINLLLLIVLLRAHVAFVLLGVFAAWLTLSLLYNRRWTTLVALVSSAALFLLWVLHKLPNLFGTVGTSRLNPLLVTVGFSYVALR